MSDRSPARQRKVKETEMGGRVINHNHSFYETMEYAQHEERRNKLSRKLNTSQMQEIGKQQTNKGQNMMEVVTNALANPENAHKYDSLKIFAD